MKKLQWKQLLISVAIPLAVGGLSAWITKDAMQEFSQVRQPPLSPPNWLFPVVWSILFVLMGIAFYLVWTSNGARDEKQKAFTVYAVQLAVNFLWSVFFFNLGWYLFSFIWLLLLWFLILETMLLFRKFSRPAGLLLIPYLAWVTFAGYLNFGVYLLN